MQWTGRWDAAAKNGHDRPEQGPCPVRFVVACCEAVCFVHAAGDMDHRAAVCTCLNLFAGAAYAAEYIFLEPCVSLLW